MILLPIVERELRVASRQGWTYWGRSSVALGSLVIVGWLLVMMAGKVNSGALARTLFGTLSGLCFGFTLFAGVLFSADSLARERREGTLGLLFLTDLQGFDIALGKLAATSLGCVYCLVAVLPVLAIPLLLGGVTALEYLRMVAVLLATLWLGLTTGLLASTLTQRAGNAAGWAALLMTLACAGVPAMGETGRHFLHLSAVTHPVLLATDWASPFVAFREAFETGPGVRLVHYQASIWFALVVGLIALVWGTWRLPGLWQDVPARIRFRTNAAATAGTRAELLALGPVVWLSNRWLSRRLTAWILLATIGVIWLLLRGFIGAQWNQVSGWVATSLVVHFCLKLWLAGEAPRVFHEERRSGGIELLITTGLSTHDLVEGRFQAIRQLYVGPWLAVTAADLAMLVGSLVDAPTSTDERILIPIFWLGRLAMLWVDAESLTATGIWVSIATVGQRTTGPTWLRVVLLPYGIWILGTMICGLAELLHVLPSTGPFNGTEAVCLVAALILLLNFGVSGFWWRRSRAGLRKEFRERASRSLGKLVRA